MRFCVVGKRDGDVVAEQSNGYIDPAESAHSVPLMHMPDRAFVASAW